MRKIYSTPNMEFVILSTEDVITASFVEIGVQYNSDDWGSGDSWLNGTNS